MHFLQISAVFLQNWRIAGSNLSKAAPLPLARPLRLVELAVLGGQKENLISELMTVKHHYDSSPSPPMRRESLSNSATKPARGHCLTGLGRVPSPLGVGRGGTINNTRPQSAALLTVLHSEVSDSQTNQRFVISLICFIHQQR